MRWIGSAAHHCPLKKRTDSCQSGESLPSPHVQPMQGQASSFRKARATMTELLGPIGSCKLAAISRYLMAPCALLASRISNLASLTSPTHLTPLGRHLALGLSCRMRRPPRARGLAGSKVHEFPLEAISPHVLVRGMSPLTGSAHTGLLSSLLAPFCAV
jgi:hypothetical protein